MVKEARLLSFISIISKINGSSDRAWQYNDTMICGNWVKIYKNRFLRSTPIPQPPQILPFTADVKEKEYIAKIKGKLSSSPY